MRHIKEGDIVEVLVGKEHSELWNLVHGPGRDRYPLRQFRVVHTPSDTGDQWYLEGWLEHIGINLTLNPNSSNLDAIVKALDAKDAADKMARIEREGQQAHG